MEDYLAIQTNNTNPEMRNKHFSECLMDMKKKMACKAKPKIIGNPNLNTVSSAVKFYVVDTELKEKLQ